MTTSDMIKVDGLAKTFVLHLMGGAELPVVKDVGLTVNAGECVVLGGPSGVGKSSILKMIYGNYRADAGQIRLRADGRWVDVAKASPRQILRLRHASVGYVSQFLRVIPRISAIDIIKTEIKDMTDAEAETRARKLLTHLSVPERLWSLPPATFSGGEQQRINIARGFAAHRPILLLDEPTASLDRNNRDAVIDLIHEKKTDGVAILAIFHDEQVRERLADRVVDVRSFTVQAGPAVQ
ncbi:MAG: phosphonate C-P lyase system protein PhnL [Hyphomicrobiaceae bacterium]